MIIKKVNKDKIELIPITWYDHVWGKFIPVMIKLNLIVFWFKLMKKHKLNEKYKVKGYD